MKTTLVRHILLVDDLVLENNWRHDRVKYFSITVHYNDVFLAYLVIDVLLVVSIRNPNEKFVQSDVKVDNFRNLKFFSAKNSLPNDNDE